MIGKLRRLWRDRRGASLVEFALILPLVLLMAGGLWEVGRVFDAYLIATNAAREGARWAALGEDQNVVNSRVNDYLTQGYGTRGDLTWGFVGFNTMGAPGDPVQVTVPVSIELYLPTPLGAMGSTLALTGSATMRLQTVSAGAATPLPTSTATATATATATPKGGKPTASATPTPGSPTATATIAPTKTPKK